MTTHFNRITYISRLLLLLLYLAFVVSCKKTTTTEPDPDLVAKVSGRYTITTFTSATGQTVTVSNGTVVILRNGTAIDTIDLTLSFATVGSSGSSSFTETKTLSLKAAGDNVDLYNGASKVGTWTAVQLTLTAYPFNNSSVNLTATK